MIFGDPIKVICVQRFEYKKPGVKVDIWRIDLRCPVAYKMGRNQLSGGDCDVGVILTDWH